MIMKKQTNTSASATKPQIKVSDLNPRADAKGGLGGGGGRGQKVGYDYDHKQTADINLKRGQIS